jgi:hypothetical protein
LAATTTGVIFAWRNASLTNKQYVERVRFELSPITLPTGPQEAALALFFQSVMSANYTGGTDLVAAPRNRILDVQRITASGQVPVSVVAAGNVMIATTAALAAGGGDVIDANPWSQRSAQMPAATAGSAPAGLVLEWKNPSQADHHNNPEQGCMILGPDQGFNITLPVALGAAFTARLTAEVDWLE